MSKWTKRFIALGVLVVVWAALAVVVAFQATPPAASAQTEETPTLEVPFLAQWSVSPHNDTESEAFVHWDAEGEVPASCAACHSTPGYVDYLGGDGSAAWSVDSPAPIGTTVQCIACHNQAAANLTSVQFLSTEVGEDGEAQPVVVSNLGPEARCMVCHQGRATKTQVDAQIERFNAVNPDEVVPPMETANGTSSFGFVNIHYYAAAVTLYGSQVHGGYEYPGKTYDYKNDHVTGYDTCVDCHNPHTTEVKVDECKVCHISVTDQASLRNIRVVQSSSGDYDGDGNVREGMADEIAGLQTILYDAIRTYASEVIQSGITYDVSAHPYWFADEDGDGAPDKNAEGRNVGFTSWTPRLLKAAYNYQVSLKDPGAFAHGNKYIVQLLYDSIEDLNSRLRTKIDMSQMARDDAGHFAGNTEAFRHWDAEGGEVPSTCARCHSATGLPQFVQHGANLTVEASNGFECATCHTSNQVTSENTALLNVNNVPFPSGAQLGFGAGDPANLCLECHQGRESTVSVNRAIGDADLDTPGEQIRFRNVHYFAAGATLFGSEARGIYEYEGKEYAGRFEHVEAADTCIECHDAHRLQPRAQTCEGCHGTTDFRAIRLGMNEDYDGDGNVTEGLAGEINTMAAVLARAMRTYSREVVGVGIIYDEHTYPYFILDANLDNKPDTNENGGYIAYNAFTPRLLKAAYNYQYVKKDPGAFAHNAKYVLQALYDSIEDLNSQLEHKINMDKMVRP